MKIALLAVIVILPGVSIACPDLEGTWFSSKEKFIEFNQRWANIDTKAWSFMLQTQGLERIEFAAENKMTINTPESEIKLGERNITNKAKTEEINYRVLGCSEKGVVIEYRRYGDAQISHFQFDDQNTFWEYVGRPGQSGNGHVREFFTRKQ